MAIDLRRFYNTKSLRLNHQLQLPDQAYFNRDTPQKYYEFSLKHNDKKWNDAVKKRIFQYEEIHDWYIINYPELLV